MLKSIGLQLGFRTDPIIGRIPSDTPVRVLEADGEWWKVSTNDGKTGYVHKSRIIRGN